MDLRKNWIIVVAVAALSVGCGQGATGADVSGSQPNYTTTKQMVLDILKSPDGKNAVQSMLQDPSFREQMAVSQNDITKAVQKSLESKQNKDLLAKQIQNPKFAAAFAKALQPQLIDMQKQLLKDPQYTKDLMVILKSPDYTKHVNELLQTPQVRGQIMKVMSDALNTPSFRMKFEDALKKAVSETVSQSGGQKQSQGGQSQGGSSGGSSGSSGQGA